MNELKRQLLEGKRVALTDLLRVVLTDLLREFGQETEDGEIVIVLPTDEEGPEAPEAEATVQG